MSQLPSIPNSTTLSPRLQRFDGQCVSVLVGEDVNEEDISVLKDWDHEYVALIVPIGWFTIRDQMDQDWTVNDPKTKGEETLYSSTFFFHPQSESVKSLLDLVKEKGWALYAFDEEKAFCLVLATGIAYDIDRTNLLKHLQEN